MRLRVVTTGVVAGAVLAAGITLATGRPPPDPGPGDDPVVAAAPTRSSGPPLQAEEGRRTAAAASEAVDTAVPGTTTGLAVYDRQHRSTVVDSGADRPMRTASVVKLLIAIDVLERHGWQAPDLATEKQLTAMLGASDDTAATALWTHHGGTEVIDRASDLLRLRDTAPPAEAEQWELTRMSPHDVVRTYTYLESQMPRPARDIVLDALGSFSATAQDGFDQRFGVAAAFGPNTQAVKQGWMPVSGQIVLNSTGVVGAGGRYVVVLMAEFPSGTDFSDARAALTDGAERLASALGQR